MIPPKRFGIFPPDWRMLRGFRCIQIFLKKCVTRCHVFFLKKNLNTRYYGDKILSKNLDLTQDFPNKILFHSLWEQNLVQNLPKIFRLPEMYSFGKILAQDFRMAAITKILMRRENQLRRFFPWGISDKQKTENT